MASKLHSALASHRGALMGAAACLCLAPPVVGALEIKLTLTGVAGIEDPKFDVLVNDVVVGSGMVLLSAKSADGEYFTADTDLDPYTQMFLFSVPDEAAVSSGHLGVRFLNDYYDAEKGIDSNLYIIAASVDGQRLDLFAAEVTDADDNIRDPLFWGEILVLPWYATATMAYKAGGLDTNGKPNIPDAAATGPASSSPQVDPVPMTTDAAAAAPERQSPATSDAVEPSDEADPVEGSLAPTCAEPRSLAVVYPNGEATLTAEARDRLDALVSAGIAGCVVNVAGYSSPGGPPEINIAVSRARAAEVEAYLRARVPQALSITAEGMGETDQFGPGPQNRRVVVSIE